MATIVKTGGGVPVSDYEALQAQLNSLQNSYNSLNSEYNSYKSSHAHTNEEYEAHGMVSLSEVAHVTGYRADCSVTVTDAIASGYVVTECGAGKSGSSSTVNVSSGTCSVSGGTITKVSSYSLRDNHGSSYGFGSNVTVWKIQNVPAGAKITYAHSFSNAGFPWETQIIVYTIS